MDDLNSTLNSILGDPNKMEQLRQVAQSLGLNPGGAPPPTQDTNAAPQQNNSSFDPAAIASILQNFQNATGAGQSAAPANNNGNNTGGFPNLEGLSKIAGILGTFNQSDKNVDLLRSLKPHFSPARAGRIDDAVRIMQLMRAWPALRDSGLLGSLGNLFGGGGSR